MIYTRLREPIAYVCHHEKRYKTLTGKKEGPCVSVFVPVKGTKSGIEESSIRLKRLLQRAEELVLYMNYGQHSINKLLTYLRMLSKHTAYIMPKQDGLVLYLSPKTLRYYKMNRHRAESLSISDHFVLDPILPSETSEFSVQ